MWKKNNEEKCVWWPQLAHFILESYWHITKTHLVERVVWIMKAVLPQATQEYRAQLILLGLPVVLHA
jgi:hypothetical protein